MSNVFTESEIDVNVVCVRVGESAGWVAEATDACARGVGEALGVSGWRDLGAGVAWPGDADEREDLVRSHVAADRGVPLWAEGFTFGVAAKGDRFSVHLSVAAGSDDVGVRLPEHVVSLSVRQRRVGDVSSGGVDGVVGAVVRAWGPAMVSASTLPVALAEQRGNWQVVGGYRLWLADGVVSVGEVARGVGVSRVWGGVLLSVPDEWHHEQVAAAMARTRELNGWDELPH
ncbi:hypothetical protein [Serinibacter salmoneus]|uniref:Uncharacterized protein n=1 Tax=Serinibacter salmoneus TaxID=556530 RepID=A0A2A9D568_9MICO|nr:hypothetical protein [Serinibacter salmoneus]PFG21000.1 hypothetical protein ATL40_2619 [Serinibacter salmoneus]